MRRLLALAVGGLSLSLGAAAPVLSPDAEVLLAEMRKAARAYRPRTDRIKLFTRAQYKYGLERDDYLHRWYDRPLWQDTSLKGGLERPRTLSPEGWRQSVRWLEAGGFDGFAAFYMRFSFNLPQRAAETGTQLLVELPDGKCFDRGPHSLMACATEIADLPSAFRMDGKVVLTRYRPETREAELGDFVEFRKWLGHKFGPDRFIVMPYSRIFNDRPDGNVITAAFLERQRESLRCKLRALDGFFPSGWIRHLYGKRYDGGFERRVVVPFLQSILAEPEFAGKKYLAMQLFSGHENCYLWRYAWDSCGTATLCDQLETIAALKPDFALACEWDEENENTCFRPMLSHGTTRLRIVRHFAERFAGRSPSLFPGDEQEAETVPNLVLSYRKSLIAGEPLEAEVRNIPDGTFAGETFQVAMRWKSPDGKVVKAFPPQRISADVCTNAWFVAKTSDFVGGHQALLPELSVKTGRGRAVYGDGFWPVDLNVARALDSKWAMMPLRDRPRGISGSAAIVGTDTNGLLIVRGNLVSDCALRSVEILEGPDSVYLHSRREKDQPLAPGADPDRTTFRVAWQGYLASRDVYRFAGRLEWRRAPGLRNVLTTGLKTEGPVWMTRTPWMVEHWDRNFYASVPNAETSEAELVVDLPPVFSGTIRLVDVMRRGAVGLSGIGGANLVVSRCTSQISIPEPYGEKNASFEIRLHPRTRTGILRIQAVDENGRVWRGVPVAFGAPSGNLRQVRVIDREDGSVDEFTVDESRAGDVVYDFSPDGGSTLLSSEGLGMSGVLGGHVPLVSGFGQAEAIGGNPLGMAIGTSLPGWDDSSPKWRKEQHGGWSLSFTNCEYASLPMQLLPPFAGFEIDMEVWPQTLGGREQGLVGDGNFGMGLWLTKEGFPEMRSDAFAAAARGPALVAGKWNRIRVRCDRRTVAVETNGASGVPVKVVGHSKNPFSTAFGATPGGVNRIGAFFNGRIRGFRVRIQ